MRQLTPPLMRIHLQGNHLAVKALVAIGYFFGWYVSHGLSFHPVIFCYRFKFAAGRSGVLRILPARLLGCAIYTTRPAALRGGQGGHARQPLICFPAKFLRMSKSSRRRHYFIAGKPPQVLFWWDGPETDFFKVTPSVIARLSPPPRHVKEHFKIPRPPDKSDGRGF